MLTAHVLLNVHQKLLWKTQTSRLEVYFHKYVQKIISPFKICTIARVELLHISLHKKWGEFNCNLTLMHLHTFCPPVAIISTAGPQQFCMSISLWDVSRGFWVSAAFCDAVDSQTLASHSIPATEIPSSRMTVRVPTIRMSFSLSVIRASTSCSQQPKQEQGQYQNQC